MLNQWIQSKEIISNVILALHTFNTGATSSTYGCLPCNAKTETEKLPPGWCPPRPVAELQGAPSPGREGHTLVASRPPLPAAWAEPHPPRLPDCIGPGERESPPSVSRPPRQFSVVVSLSHSLSQEKGPPSIAFPSAVMKLIAAAFEKVSSQASLGCWRMGEFFGFASCLFWSE